MKINWAVMTEIGHSYRSNTQRARTYRLEYSLNVLWTFISHETKNNTQRQHTPFPYFKLYQYTIKTIYYTWRFFL